MLYGATDVTTYVLTWCVPPRPTRNMEDDFCMTVLPRPYIASTNNYVHNLTIKRFIIIEH